MQKHPLTISRIHARCAFPQWFDLSDENIKRIKKWISRPNESLRKSVEDGFWISKWGKRSEILQEALKQYDRISENAPALIPLFKHRYVSHPPSRPDFFNSCMSDGSVSRTEKNEFFEDGNICRDLPTRIQREREARRQHEWPSAGFPYVFFNACIRRRTDCSRKAVGVRPTTVSNLRVKCGRVLKPHPAAISVIGKRVKRSCFLATVIR